MDKKEENKDLSEVPYELVCTFKRQFVGFSLSNIIMTMSRSVVIFFRLLGKQCGIKVDELIEMFFNGVKAVNESLDKAEKAIRNDDVTN